MNSSPARERYFIGSNGVFATLYDRETDRMVVDNGIEEQCRRTRNQLLVQAHDLDSVDASFALLAPGRPAQPSA